MFRDLTYKIHYRIGPDDVVAASELPIYYGADYFNVTGTTTINTIKYLGKGYRIYCRFTEALTINHSANLELPDNANLTVAADDVLGFVQFDDDKWICLDNPVKASELISDTAYSADWNGVTDIAPSQNAVYDKFVSVDASISGKISDVAYAASWAGVTTTGASKNALYYKFVSVGEDIDAKVSDTAYASSWDTVTTIAPSKNAVYDKIEAIVSDTAASAAWDGVTDVAPSKNATWDALELKADAGANFDITRMEGFLVNELANVAIGGSSTLVNISTGTYNFGLHNYAGSALTSGAHNCFIGYDAGSSVTTASNNVAIGQNALTGFGAGIGQNIAIGYNAADTIALGNYATAIGSNTLDATGNVDCAIAIGYDAASNGGTGSRQNSIFIGREAGEAHTNYNLTNCIYIGNEARGANNSHNSNEITIGYNIRGMGTDTVTIGNATTTATYIKGIANIVHGGGIKFPATQIPANEANTLDDYEGGNFTPAVTFGGNAVSLTYTTQYGFYTKIGNLLYFTIRITLLAKGSSTGNAEITGLPFSLTNASASEYRTFSILPENITFSGSPRCYGAPGQSYLRFGDATSGGSLTRWTNANFVDGSQLTITGGYTV